MGIISALHSGNVQQLQPLKEQDKDYYISWYEGFIAYGHHYKICRRLMGFFLGEYGVDPT